LAGIAGSREEIGTRRGKERAPAFESGAANGAS
jgi:hypothetical protein